MKKYLVTGGCGALGAPLVKALVAAGHKVRVVDDCSRGNIDRLKGVACEVWLGDIRHARWMAETCKDVDSAIHLAAVNGTTNFYEEPYRVLEVGVKGIVNLMDGCIQHGVREIAVASSSEAYQTPPTIPTPENVPLSVPNPHNPRYTYGGSKILTELMALHYGEGCFDRRLVFRPHNVYGPDMGKDHVVPQLIDRVSKADQEVPEGPLKIHLLGDGLQTRAFCYIDDAVSGILTVLEKGANLGVYNIGTEEEVTIQYLANLIGICFSRVIEYHGIFAPDGEALRRCPSIRKLRGLGWEPKVSLKEGLERTVAWYKENRV